MQITKPLLALILGACAASPERPAAKASQTEARPNVVIILTDDMGYGDLSSHGHPLIRTPNIDRLAAEGQRWTSFYASSPLCNPSRIALMTGRMPIRIHGDLNRWGNLPESEITLGDMFGDAGYATAYIGKWGMSGRFADGGVHPNDAGFDYFYGVEDFNDGGRRPEVPHTYEGMKAASWEDFVFSLWRQKDEIESPTHQPTLTKRYTEESVGWMREQIAEERPFFLYLGHTMPHVPIFASPEFEGHSRAGLYGDVIEELDGSVGEVIAALGDAGVAEDTLVVFSSDNGPWLTYHDLGGSPGPFRDGKHSAWEGGFRVPGIF
ncbi:MAG: sulfatase-like hydrolase/transferase, partial [Acidobacteriota bacterium]|nr:sulfatase-like hydrolase/transferase [Acidobacteriota bacterium]